MNAAALIISVLFTGTFVSLALAAYAWQRRAVASARELAGLCLAIAVWNLGYAFELLLPDLASRLLWVKIEYLGIAASPVLWLFFTLMFTGRGAWLTRVRQAALLAIPILTMLLFWTNEAHGLIWKDVVVDVSSPLNTLKPTYGYWFWIYISYSYVTLLSGAGLLVLHLAQAPPLHRRQTALLLIGALAPLAANVLYLTGHSIYPSLDLTPPAFTLSGLALTLGVLRFRFLELGPMGRDAVIEAMRDGMLVLDATGRIVDINPAAAQLLGAKPDQLRGHLAAQALPGWPEQDAAPAAGGTRIEIATGAGPQRRYYELRLSPLFEDRRPAGQTVLMQDITQRKQTEARLQAQYNITRILAEASSLSQATPSILQTVCESLGWDLGELWTLANGQDYLSCSDIWQAAGMDLGEFITRTRAITFARDQGLPGRVWANARPEWVPDVTHDPLFLRADVARRSGLRGAYAFPVPSSFGLHGVMVFFSRYSGDPAPETLAMLDAVGSQAGQFVDRKHTEAALRAGEAKRRAVLDAIPDLVLRLNVEGDLLDHFAAKEDTWAMPAEAEWQSIQQAMPAEVAAQFMAMVRNVLETDDIGILEYRRPVTMLSGTTLMRDYEARIVASGRDEVVALVRDITKRRRAEEALRLSEERFRQLAENIRQVFWLTDGAGQRFIYISPAYEEVWGRSCQSLYDQPFSFLGGVHPLDRERVLSAETQKRTGQYDIEFRVLRPDGSVRWVWSRAFPIANERDEVYRIAGISEDITERKQAQEERTRLYHAIVDERSRLQALITSSRDGVIMIGNDQRILVMNQAALELLRLPGDPGLWLGRGLADVLLEMRRVAGPAVHGFLAEARRVIRGDLAPGEGEMQVPPRALRWLNLPVQADGQAIGRLVVLRDVTEERLLEKMRDDLTHTMVHDLRNPLTGINLALEILEKDNGGAAAGGNRMLGIARASAERMLTLVNAILDVSRLESGRMPLEQRRVALATLAQEALQIQVPMALDQNLRLEIRVPSDLPLAWIDPGLITRVLQNLVGNAIKFTPAGGQILVIAAVDPGDAGMLQVHVQDTGPGLPPQLQGKLFQKFVTGRAAGSGSGLGLAFCRLAVEAHGGRISAESEPGQGTTFIFSLPLARE